MNKIVIDIIEHPSGFQKVMDNLVVALEKAGWYVNHFEQDAHLAAVIPELRTEDEFAKSVAAIADRFRSDSLDERQARLRDIVDASSETQTPENES